ncbi:MAG: spermidine synthase [Anaerolineae bacterium]
MKRVPNLYLTVLVGGFCSLSVEMAASRLLNNYFGSSQIVWAVLIGLILVYLTLGYYLGGRLADRFPEAANLYRLVAWAGLTIGLIPFVAQPILRYGQIGLDRYLASLLAASLFGVVALFSVPMTLLGCISPYATRLAMREVIAAGNVSGRIYAISTVGSIAGTFLPVLVLIPTIGTKLTLVLLSLLLLATTVYGLARLSRLALVYAAMPIVVVGLTIAAPGGVVKSVPGMIYQQESPYNYIQVVQEGSARYLLLNEGQGVHSIYDPQSLLTGSIWDLFLVAPYFNQVPFTAQDVRSLCLIGLAAGTISKQYTAVYGPIPIDGVEIDPDIIEVGRRYFDMNEPNLNAVAQDGRYFLANSPQQYDVIGVDAYRPPYIPPHLTTKEFFQEALAHLTERGVVAINAGRTRTDYSLVEALASTMTTVFPSVYVIDLPSFSAGLSNSLVVGTRQRTALSNFAGNVKLMQQPELQAVASRAVGWAREFQGQSMVFTDDKAPVEQVVHKLIINFIRGSLGQ